MRCLSGVPEVAALILVQATYLSWRLGYEIMSRIILSLLLIQVGQLSVNGESMGTLYWLTTKEACPRTVLIG